jgi:hypothetical protein
MPDIDLDPGAYRVKGRKEPILLPGWWIGPLVFIAMIAFSTTFIRPLYQAWMAWWRTLF